VVLMTAKVSNLAAEAFGWTLLALYWILRSAKKLSASVMLPMRGLRENLAKQKCASGGAEDGQMKKIVW